MRDGAVLPILNLNGYKIANPTILARISHEELEALFIGYGYTPYFVEGDDPAQMHQKMAATLDRRSARFAPRRRRRAHSNEAVRPRWPMIVLRSPKGWTGPKEINGHKVEGSWRSHQVPFADVRDNPANLKLLEDWMRSYKPEELFDADGRLVPELQALAPHGHRRMSANPHANGGLLRKDLKLPDFRDYAVDVPTRGTVEYENTQAARRVPARRHEEQPDQLPRLRSRRDRLEPAAGGLRARARRPGWPTCCPRTPTAASSRRDGRVMEMLSEHTLIGWLEGYLLTGRHGFFHTYEAFAHVIDSMFNQHAKWLDISKNHVPWRAPVASENILLSSTVWRQDHNGFSHQDPGFIDLVTNKSPSVTRVYLPPDANTLLAVADHCLRSTDYINVIVADKQKHLQFTTIDEAVIHCAKGLGIWARASTDAGEEPDVVLASCGDVATMEALAAAAILRERVPDLKLRFVNVVDLFRLQPAVRASARVDRARVRRPVHHRQADHLQLPRLSVADPQARLSLQGPRPPARPRLQGKGQHQHAARAGDAERDVALPPRHRRDRSRAEAAHEGRAPEGGDEERDHRQHALCARARHRSGGDRQLDVAVLEPPCCPSLPRRSKTMDRPGPGRRPTPVTADEALARLVAGNERFRRSESTWTGIRPESLADLAKRTRLGTCEGSCRKRRHDTPARGRLPRHARAATGCRAGTDHSGRQTANRAARGCRGQSGPSHTARHGSRLSQRCAQGRRRNRCSVPEHTVAGR